MSPYEELRQIHEVTESMLWLINFKTSAECKKSYKYLEKTWNYSGEMHSTKITQTFEQTSKHATGKFCLLDNNALIVIMRFLTTTYGKTRWK